MSLTLHSISKYYGKQAALEQVSFQVQDGEVAGFLGPNGAGKSTLMKIATGFLKADEGYAEINGTVVDESNVEIRRHIGYLPEHNPLYPDLYVKEYLLYIAGLYHLGKQAGSRVDEMIERTGLTHEYKKRIGDLSKGFRQRVGLAQALMHNPEVLILDEPTTGLDPNQLEEIRQLIRELGKEKTVLFSTHIMQEVKALCKRVIIIHQGHIVADGSEEELLTQHTQGDVVTQVEFSTPVETNLLMTLEHVNHIVPISSTFFEIHSNADVRAGLFHFAVARQLEILTLQHQRRTMENVFKELTLNG
ncbi:MAG: ATP-binding cassette domain-containing protein [Microbacter sp.]